MNYIKNLKKRKVRWKNQKQVETSPDGFIAKLKRKFYSTANLTLLKNEAKRNENIKIYLWSIK